MSYDAVKDFVPVSMLAVLPNILVIHPSVPASSVKELIALAKSKPGQLNFGSSGSGSSIHMSGEMFKSMAGIDIVHIPYKGAAQSVIALLGGEIQMMFDNIVSSLPHVKAGKLKALAVTGATRSPVVPDLPTVAEDGLPGFAVYPWIGIVAPARTPTAIVTKLNTEIAKVLNMPEVKEQFFSMGAETGSYTPEQFAAFIKAEIVKWAKVVKESGARAD